MSSFTLSSSDSRFSNRVNSIFDSLDTISNNLEQNSLPENPHKRKCPDTTEDNFKVPKFIRRRRNRNTPDYVNHPEKWVKYSMKDVQCLSDSENKKLGLEFFSKLKSESAASVSEELDEKIVFKKLTKINEVVDTVESKTQPTKSTGFLLPEYEVGKKKCKKTSNKSESESPSKKSESSAITLSHLEFEEEVDEEA